MTCPDLTTTLFLMLAPLVGRSSITYRTMAVFALLDFGVATYIVTFRFDNATSTFVMTAVDGDRETETCVP